MSFFRRVLATITPAPGLHVVTGASLLGVAGLAFITFVCFRLDVGLAPTAFAHLILVVVVSLWGSFYTSAILSVLAVACLNFFFTAPLFEFPC